MGYYQGDWYRGYRGDYMRGDPGFFSFLGGIGKALGGVPVIGPVLSAGGEALAKIGAPRVGTLAARSSTAIAKMRGGILKHPVLSAAGAAGVVGLGAGGLAEKMIAGGGCPKGHHMSKRNGHCVRNRHMRVTNPKALRRSLRRAHGFAKLAMRTIHLIHPKKKARFGGFRRRKR